MNAVTGITHDSAAQAVGWALLHFIWQAALIGAISALVLRLLRRTAPDVRYVVGTIGLSLMFTMPVVTAVQLWRASVNNPGNAAADAVRIESPAAQPTRARPAAEVAIRIASAADAVAPRPRALETWMPSLVFGWACGVIVLTIRLMTGWL